MNDTAQFTESNPATGMETRTFKLTPAENRKLQTDATATAGGNVSEYIKSRLFTTPEGSEIEYAEMKAILNAAESRSVQTEIMHRYIIRTIKGLSTDLKRLITDCLNANQPHIFTPLAKELNDLQGTCDSMKETLETDAYFMTDKPEQFLQTWKAEIAKEDGYDEED